MSIWFLNSKEQEEEQSLQAGKKIKQVGQTDVASEIQQLEPCQITIFEYLNSAFVCACLCVSVWLSVRKVYTSASAR